MTIASRLMPILQSKTSAKPFVFSNKISSAQTLRMLGNKCCSSCTWGLMLQELQVAECNIELIGYLNNIK